jgi:hypothetical protein
MEGPDERAERIVRNEALFRSVNERVKAINEAFSVVLEQTDFVCECGIRDCTQTIRLTLAEYEQVRADSSHFAIAPGHEVPDVEDVIRRNERYAVVRKRAGLPRELAEDLDQRS